MKKNGEKRAKVRQWTKRAPATEMPDTEQRGRRKDERTERKEGSRNDAREMNNEKNARDGAEEGRKMMKKINFSKKSL